MSSFYEASTSGMNWDRFTADLNDPLLHDSTTLKVKQAFWSARQLLREKLGKREDEHVVAADAELDDHLQTFRQIRHSTQTLVELMEAHQRELSDLAQLELDITELLTEAQADEKAHLRKVLQVTANAQANSSKQRHILLGHVIRFGNVLSDFTERAVSDCEQTVEAVERARLDYRGSLLWLKKCSDSLDPGDSSHMEDFRRVQHVVKCQKHRLDQLKEDMALKVSVLQKARNQILTDHLEEYKRALFNFHSENAAEFCASAEQFDGLESYEIDVLKILNDPIGLAMEEQQQRKTADNKPHAVPSKPKRAVRHNAPSPPLPTSTRRNRQPSENDDTNDLIELDEVELGVQAIDPSMDRVRELLRFDDDDDAPTDGHADSSVSAAAAATLGVDDDDWKDQQRKNDRLLSQAGGDGLAAQAVDRKTDNHHVKLKCPAATTTSAADIGLNLLSRHSQHGASAAMMEQLLLFDDDDHVSSSSAYHHPAAAADRNNAAADDVGSSAENDARNGGNWGGGGGRNAASAGGGALLLEEIEDLLFESCPSSPKNNGDGAPRWMGNRKLRQDEE